MRVGKREPRVAADDADGGAASFMTASAGLRAAHADVGRMYAGTRFSSDRGAPSRPGGVARRLCIGSTLELGVSVLRFPFVASAAMMVRNQSVV